MCFFWTTFVIWCISNLTKQSKNDKFFLKSNHTQFEIIHIILQLLPIKKFCDIVHIFWGLLRNLELWRFMGLMNSLRNSPSASIKWKYKTRIDTYHRQDSRSTIIKMHKKFWKKNKNNGSQHYPLINYLNPNWHELWMLGKCSSLAPPRSMFYSMSLAGCQIIPIDLNFQLQICLEIFDKNSADKIQSKNYKGCKSTLSHAN